MDPQPSYYLLNCGEKLRTLDIFIYQQTEKVIKVTNWVFLIFTSLFLSFLLELIICLICFKSPLYLTTLLSLSLSLWVSDESIYLHISLIVRVKCSQIMSNIVFMCLYMLLPLVVSILPPPRIIMLAKEKNGRNFHLFSLKEIVSLYDCLFRIQDCNANMSM